jgi:two-component system sensor histidine kinase/response regulator
VHISEFFPDRPVTYYFRGGSRLATIVLVLMGSLGLAGWWLDIAVLRHVEQTWSGLQSSTALGFLLSGLALWGMGAGSPSYRLQLAGRVSAGMVVLLGLLGLTESLAGGRLAIETWLVGSANAVPMHGAEPMELVIAFNFLLTGLALLLLDKDSRHGLRPSEWLVLPSLMASFLTVAGAMYGTDTLSPLTTHTALGFALLGSAILGARPDRGWMAVVTSDLLGGIVMRRLIPVVLLVIPLLFWVRLLGEQRGYYDTELGIALMLLGNTLILCNALWLTARFLNRAETLRREAETQLGKFSLAIEQSPENTVITNLAGEIEYVNAAFLGTTGYSYTEVIGRNPRFMKSGMTPPEVYRTMWATLCQGRSWAGELINRRKDGHDYVAAVTITPLRNRDGAISHYVGVQEDITENKRMSAELEHYRHHLESQVEERTLEAVAARDHAERLSRVKSAFLANMSHEIRTPINAVLGFSDLCLRIELPARGRGYVEKIHGAASSLLGVINDILDFSKLEAGKLELDSTPFSLGEVLHRVASLFNLRAREKGVELVIGAQPGIPDRLLGDPLRLGQVLINLVGNAIKFTDHGEVILLVEPLPSPEATDPDRISLRFSIQDTGPGIPLEQQSELFAAFHQADNSTTRKFGGTGLGLAISKQLVERMGGRLCVDSSPGTGACFSFTVQIEITGGEAVPTPARSSLVGKRVLVVDDNAVMRTLLSRGVEAFGCNAVAMGSGEDALVQLQSRSDIDLILLDWRLPGLDGLATARRIRATGNLLPIVLVTGDEPEKARAEAKEGEVHSFLAKPVSQSTLHDTLAQVLGGHAVLPPLADMRAVAPDLGGARILVVDDNDFNRQVARELVELSGAQVSTVDDGAQAVTAVADGNFDLVLMDLQMPVMDGYMATRIIRATRPDLPILALTAHAIVDEKARVLEAGMNDIITKPILPNTLYATLAKWLDGKVFRNPAADAPALPTVIPTSDSFPDPRLVPPDVQSGALHGFDLTAGLARVNGDRQLLDRFLRLFRERNARCVADIGAALAQQDGATARRLAHALKGGAGTVGAIDLQASASRMEAALEPGKFVSRESALCYLALEAEWARTLDTLAGLLDRPAENNPPPDT